MNIKLDQFNIQLYVVSFGTVAPNAFPDCSSQFSATVYLMLATTVVLIGGTGFAANKTYSAHPASKGNISIGCQTTTTHR